MRGLSPRARSAVVLVALLSLIGSVVALLYGQRLHQPETIDTDSFTDGAIGHDALVELYRSLGVHVLVDREGVYDRASAPVMFIEPRTAVKLDGRLLRLDRALEARVDAGLDSIVVLPKWSLDPETGAAIRPYKADVEEVLDALPVYGGVRLRREDLAIPETAMLREWTVPGRRGDRRVVLQERQTLRIDGYDLEPLLGTNSSALVVITPGSSLRGRIIIVSDADLLHNYNLQRGDHARIAQDLVEVLGSDTIVIDEVFHGHGYHLTLGAVLGQFPNVLLVAHALLLALLFALAGIRGFGRERPPAPDRGSTRGLVELATRVLIAGSREERITNSYVMRILDATADRLGVPQAKVMATRARALDKIAEQRGLPTGAEELVKELRSPRQRRRSIVDRARAAYEFRRRLLGRGRS